MEVMMMDAKTTEGQTSLKERFEKSFPEGSVESQGTKVDPH